MSPATVALGLDGEMVYANPAFAAMLGHHDASVLTGQSVSRVMIGYADTSAADCVTALRVAVGAVTAWCHVDGHHRHAVVSKAVLVRATDPLLLVTLTDVAALS